VGQWIFLFPHALYCLGVDCQVFIRCQPIFLQVSVPLSYVLTRVISIILVRNTQNKAFHNQMSTFIQPFPGSLYQLTIKKTFKSLIMISGCGLMFLRYRVVRRYSASGRSQICHRLKYRKYSFAMGRRPCSKARAHKFYVQLNQKCKAPAVELYDS
jgi:hypothetical protein